MEIANDNLKMSDEKIKSSENCHEQNCNQQTNSDQWPTTNADATDGENPEATAYLQHLLNDGSKEGDSGYEMEMPSWYDEKMFKQGQDYMNKYRFVIQSGMLAGLVAVLAIPSILKVLVCTRQSSTPATAYRRYVRTMLHTTSWYNHSPNDKSSKFWTSLRAVRKAHSRSSRACAKLAGAQITQKDLALTQFGFIGFLTLGTHRIEMNDPEFLECTSHMWRVLGYLLGIKDEYNICGRNWAESRLRLDIVMRKVYEPALENTTKEFEEMCNALLNGLWHTNTSLTVGSYLFMTKRLCYVKGYEYYDFDCRPGTKLDTQQYRYYKNLGWWDRIIVFYGLFIVTYLHKYAIVRWYLNFRVWLNEQMMKYLPYVAILKFGTKWSYVCIFTQDNRENDFENHLKED